MSLLTRIQIAVPDRYKIDREIARGGMSVIFAGTDTTLDCPVAVKVLKPELATADGARRFMREARTLANLKHPNVLSVHEVGEWGGLYFFVMDLVSGKSLADELKAGPMSEDRVRAIGRELLDALELVHDAQVVHRDIKPANILMVHRHPVLADFGIARVADSTQDALTREGETPGTPEYMAPEVLRGGAATTQSDLYAIGAVLYESATGRRWRLGDSTVWKGAPAGLVPVLRKALAERAGDRFVDARSFRDALTLRKARSTTVLLSLAAVLVAAAFGIGVWMADRPEPVTESVVLILPFEDMTGEGTLGHVADGLNSEMITVVSTSPWLQPIGRLTARTFEGQAVDLDAIQSELGAAYVITGEIRGDESQIRVTMVLTSTADGVERWSDSYQFAQNENLTRQEDIAWAALFAMEAEVGVGTPSTPFSRHDTRSSEAYEAYRQGREAWESRHPGALLQEALPAFQRAVELDSTYALAWAGLADVYNVLGAYDYGVLLPRDAFSQARGAAARALALRPDLGEALTTMANTVFNFERDLPGAEELFLAAREASPGYAQGHQWYSIVLQLMGRPNEALASARRGLRNDLRSPVQHTQVARLLYLQSDYHGSAQGYRDAIALDATFAPAIFGLGMSLLAMDSVDAAIGAFERGVEATGGMHFAPYALLGYTKGLEGDREAAAEAMAILQSAPDGLYMAPEYVALVHIGLGQPDAAVDSFYAANRNGSNAVFYLSLEPLLDPLRGYPAFQELLDSARVWTGS